MKKPKSEIKKPDLLQCLKETLVERLAVLEKAARASHAEATHESSKAENKYDTRGLEAAYLAGGQARHAREIAEAIKVYESLPLKDFGPKVPVDLSALVELEVDNMSGWYFIGPTNGGLEFDFQGNEITVITPQSPLGQELIGKSAKQRWTSKRDGVAISYYLKSLR